MLNYFAVTPICTSIKNPQSNVLVKRIHQVIYNIIVTKDIDIKVYDYIDTWGVTLDSVAWAIR